MGSCLILHALVVSTEVQLQYLVLRGIWEFVTVPGGLCNHDCITLIHKSIFLLSLNSAKQILLLLLTTSETTDRRIWRKLFVFKQNGHQVICSLG